MRVAADVRYQVLRSTALKGAAVVAVTLFTGCSSAPSRNILGSYFPSWMVCALGGIAVGLIARVLFSTSGLIEEIPAPFAVILAIVVAATCAFWLAWLA